MPGFRQDSDRTISPDFEASFAQGRNVHGGNDKYNNAPYPQQGYLNQQQQYGNPQLTAAQRQRSGSTPERGRDVPKHLVQPRGASRVFTQSMIGSDFPFQRPDSPATVSSPPQAEGRLASTPPTVSPSSSPLPANAMTQQLHSNPYNRPQYQPHQRASPYNQQSTQPIFSQQPQQPRHQPQMQTPQDATSPVETSPAKAAGGSAQPAAAGVQRQPTLQGHNIYIKKEPSIKAQPTKSLLKGPKNAPHLQPQKPQQQAKDAEEFELPRAGSVLRGQINVEVRQMEVTSPKESFVSPADGRPSELPMPSTEASTAPATGSTVPASRSESTLNGAAPAEASTPATPANATGAAAPEEDLDGYDADILNSYRLSMASNLTASLARPKQSNRVSFAPTAKSTDDASSKRSHGTEVYVEEDGRSMSGTEDERSLRAIAADHADAEEVVVDEEEGDEDEEEEEEGGSAEDEEYQEEEDYFDFDGYIDGGEVAEADPNAPVCAFCEEPITEKPTHILGRYWHLHHSRCKECRRPIGVDNFAEIDGFLFCEDHYYEVRGEYRVRKSNPKKKRASVIESELQQIQTLSTVRKVRNLFNFEKSVRLNIVTLDEDDGEAETGETGGESKKRPRRFVTSFIAPPSVGENGGILDSIDPAVAAQLIGRRPVLKGPQPLGGTGRHASVVGAPRPMKKKSARKFSLGKKPDAAAGGLTLPGLAGSKLKNSPEDSNFPSPDTPNVTDKLKDRRATVLI
ncbi:Transforming growth factor beta-1-induced transcript 1 protein [Phlyctochytrium bullatum]|nr:Transforming growth factor beta-1-induced transcript 1 protein [Phlyctochytrium bullatum]